MTVPRGGCLAGTGSALLLWVTAAEAAAPDEGLRVGGLVEGAYSYNAGRPFDRLTRWRGFDARHDAFQVLMASLGADFRWRIAYTRVALQVGQTPSTYYRDEPTLPGIGGVGPSDATLWRYLQTALAGVHLPVGDGLDVEGGLFLSPIGNEGIVARDLWHASLANMSYGLPFYHVGVHATQALPAHMSLTLGVMNGWNHAVDDNDGKTLHVQWNLDRDRVDAQLVYLGGNEQPEGSPLGHPWRSELDAWTRGTVSIVSLTGRITGGLEDRRTGLRWWAGGLVDVLVRPHPLVELALRGDVLSEQGAGTTDGVAPDPIFFPASTVGSITGTVGARLLDNGVVRLEARHDRASAPIYSSAAEGVLTDHQTTITLLFSTWFDQAVRLRERPPRGDDPPPRAPTEVGRRPTRAGPRAPGAPPRPAGPAAPPRAGAWRRAPPAAP